MHFSKGLNAHIVVSPTVLTFTAITLPAPVSTSLTRSFDEELRCGLYKNVYLYAGGIS